MGWELNEQEYQAVLALSAQCRYEYLIKRVADADEVWSLAAGMGWALAADEYGNEAVPIWPHVRYAAACAVNEWAGNESCAIAISDWMDKWLPGMSRVRRQVAVFPTPSSKATVVSPERLRQDLQDELLKYK